MLPRRYPLKIRSTSFIERAQHRRLYESSAPSRCGTRPFDEPLLDPPRDGPAERLFDRRVAKVERARGLRPVVGVAVDQRPRELSTDTRGPPPGPADRLRRRQIGR